MPAERTRAWLFWILGVVALASVVLFIVVPQLLGAIQRSMAKRTLADMTAIGNALAAYKSANSSYPSFPERTAVRHLRPFLEPRFIKTLPLTDVWQFPLFIVSTPDHYEIWSLGADGHFGPNLSDGPTDTWDADIVLRDDEFVRYPVALRH